MTGRSLWAGLRARLPWRSAPPPGWSAARVSADGRVRTAVWGAARADGDAVTPATLFQAASCSKTANALLVLRLAADGALDLDAPLNAQLRGWRLEGRHGSAATPAGLLSHTAGVGVPSFPGYASGVPLPDARAILGGTPPADTPMIRATHRPGRFRYAGGGTMAAQLLVEEVGGAPWGGLLRDRILDPLGIADATSTPEPRGAVAHGHDPRGVPMAEGWRRYPEAAAAGLWITAEGLARLGHGVLGALKGRGGSILPRALAERMHRPVSGGAALGLFVHGGRMWHDGANPGYRCVVLLDPARGEATAVMTNGDGGTAAFRPAIEALG